MGINLDSAEINVLNSGQHQLPLVNLKTWEISVLKIVFLLSIQVSGSWVGKRQVPRTLPLPGPDLPAGLSLELFQRTVE